MPPDFAHEAVLTLTEPGDIRAPGAAITVELCGHWEHDGPCPLAPHLTDATRVGDEVRLRVTFTAEASAETEVRARIDRALARGELEGTRWGLIACGPA